jgi:trehalose/maltose transport system permease protein
MSQNSQLRRSQVRSVWLFLAPMLIVLVLVAGWPLFRTIYFGFTDANFNRGLDEMEFVGLDNYHRCKERNGETRCYGLLHDDKWWTAVKNTLRFAAFSVTIETVLGLIFALFLNASFRGRGLVRAAVLIPWAIPTIVSAKMWGLMLHDQNGFINRTLKTLGLTAENRAWTADPDLVMSSVVAVDVWKTTPFMTLLILAALQMLPRQCYEAARVDGVHPIKVFFRVTLPLIKPALMVAVIFRLLDALRIFDLIWVLTPGSQDTISMSVYVRQLLMDGTGKASAAATLLFFIIALITILYIMLARVRLGEEPT